MGLSKAAAVAALMMSASVAPAWGQASERPENPVGQGLYGPLDTLEGSPLYAAPIEIAPGVFSAIGATQPATVENGGHNNNLSFVIGEKGVLVINGGASWALAEAIHQEIKARTDLPVLFAVAENGQGHAMLGMSYWRANGVSIVAQADGAAAFEAEAYEIADRATRIDPKPVGDGEPPTVDETFDERRVFDLGGVTAEAINFGSAHSPGDVAVLIPEREVIFAGDMAFHVRMPPIFEDTDTAAWLESWERFAEVAAPLTIVPGHGGPTDLATVTAGTKDYLLFLRGEVAKVLEAGGSLQDAYEIDQTRYRDWHTYWELAARNAGRVFEAMEFE